LLLRLAHFRFCISAWPANMML